MKEVPNRFLLRRKLSRSAPVKDFLLLQVSPVLKSSSQLRSFNSLISKRK